MASDEKTFAAAPKEEGPRNDRAPFPGNMKHSVAGSAVFAHDVGAHPLSAMVCCAVSMPGRAAPHFAPDGTYLGAPYFIGGISESRCYPQIRIAADDQPFVSMRGPARPRVAVATQKWLDSHMKGAGEMLAS